MSTGKLPFTKPNDKTTKDIFTRIKNGQMNKLPDQCSEDLRDLILKLLDPKPEKRLGFKDVRELLDHPFFENCFDSDRRIKKNSLKKDVFNVKEKFSFDFSTVIPQEVLLPEYSIDSYTIKNNYIKGFDYNTNKIM
jgi:serine/threonine protein kinase